MALRDFGRRPQDPQPGREDHDREQMLSHSAPSHSLGLAHPEQPERALVAVRLCVPGKIGHAHRIHGELLGAHRPGRLRERQRRASADRLQVRVRSARHHSALLVASRQSRRQGLAQFASEERADSVLSAGSRATRRIRQIFELTRVSIRHGVEK